MVAQPTGTVTLLFTDVEGSTQLLERLGAERFAEALALHRRVLREAFARHGGYEVDEEGDAFLVAFQAAGEAVAAAGEAQQGLASLERPHEDVLRVRMGVHTGEPLSVPPKYVGMDVHRAARIMSAGHGGQVLVSETTAALLDGVPLRDLGPHRLKDMLGPIRLYQLEVDGLPVEFPPLRSLHQTNLPVAAWPLLGREQELAEIRELVAGNARLVTLTGAGGSGKTRLALQAAAELSDQFTDGVFFVGLAPLRATDAVRAVVAEAVGLQADDDVVAWLRSRRALLVLDNLEHLDAVETVVSELLVGDVVVLATSRAPLHLSAERELPVEPLPEAAAVELFVSRAAAAGRQVEADATVADVCRRLDNLPLALELAAARAKLLSPAALLDRLDAALPLLSGGARDLPERQRTLRATIEWSHDLLDDDAKAAFRRLSVFRGSFTLDAAEAVTGADLDQVAGLLDQSLLKPLGHDRFFLLETIREYARERLERANEDAECASRHARHYLAELEARASAPAGLRLAWFADEEDNLRGMLDQLVATAPTEAVEALKLLGWYWLSRDAYVEQRQRADALLAQDGLPENTRARLLLTLASTMLRVGDAAGAELATSEALAIVEPRSADHVQALLFGSTVSLHRGESERSVQLALEAVELAREFDDHVRLSILNDAGVTLADAGHLKEAREMWAEAREGFVRIGKEVGPIVAASNLAWLDLSQRDFETARAGFASTLATARSLGHIALEADALRGLGLALLGLHRPGEARAAFSNLLDLEERLGASPVTIIDAIAGIALSTTAANAREGARLRGAATAVRQSTPRDWQLGSDDLEGELERPIIEVLGAETWAQEQAAGAALTLDETIALARTLARAEVPAD